MRELTLGVFLGVWVTLIIALIERYKMTDYLWVSVIIVSIVLIFIACWRIILNFIAKVNPELWLKINQINKPTIYDEAMQKRLEDRKSEREAKKNDRRSNKKDDNL
jgi:type VI protein secretion system component VasK